MKKLVCNLIAATVLLMGTAVAQADSRSVFVGDHGGRSHGGYRSHRPDRDFDRRRDDSRHGFRGYERRLHGGRDDHRDGRRGYRDHHGYRGGDWRHDRHRGWRHGSHGYLRSYWRDDGHRYYRGSRYYDDGPHADLQVILDLPLW